MRDISVIVYSILCYFCLLRTAIGQTFDVRVNLEEGKDAGQPVHSFPLPASNEVYTFFPAQDADSKAALTLFQISEQGVVTTTKPIDFEIGKKNYYDLVAVRRDRGDKEGGVPLSIRISITDTNNFGPTFPSNLYHGRVKENSPVDTIVLGLENCFAEDRDTEGSITYSISGGNEKGYFKAEGRTVNNINRVFLVLKTTNIKIVRDVNTPEIILTVRAFDGRRFGTTKVSITVLDVNNNDPKFDKDTYTATINEDTPLMTSVLRVRATDADVGTNGGIYYYIRGGSPWFSVDAITGVMKVVSRLPNQAAVDLRVTAQDRGRDATRSHEAVVKVNINLIADYPPADTASPGANTPPVFPEGSYSANVREDFPVGAAVLVIHAVDRDPPGRNSRIQYRLSGDNAFQINPDNGVVSLRTNLDYSLQNSYDLNVIAQDQAQNPLSAEASLKITVQQVDKNRFAPEFQAPDKYQRQASIPENRAINTKVGSSIIATDSDGSQRPEGQVVYSIASGSGLPYFKIDANTGDLRSVAVLDKEKQPQYNLLIEARDKSLYPLKSNLYMVIAVTGVEDNFPDFSQPVYSAKVPGNAPRGTFVTAIHAIDQDGDAVTYSIDNAGSAFTIQADSGVITTARPLDPANEERKFVLSVRATAANKDSRAQVIVDVVSKADSPPTFVNLPYKATVPENLGQIDSLLCLAAKDSQGKPVTYSIASDTDGKFSVEQDSGRFSATGSFDYEAFTGGVYQVQASSGPQQIATESVTIAVTDTKDPPKFSKGSYKFVIDEDTSAGTTIAVTNQDGSSGGLVIEDADTTITNFECTIENIQSLDIENHFTIRLVTSNSNKNGECKLITQSSFEHFDTPKFTFEVRATDTNYRNMFASAQVEIEIKDKNNNAPVFSQQSYWASVDKNFPVRNSILKVTATDKDSGSFGEITYGLDPNTQDRNRFSLDSNTGVLSSASSLAEKTYNLIVEASDRAQNGNNVRRSRVEVYVQVYAPGTTFIQFDPASYSKDIAENVPRDTNVFKVTAKGPNSIRYSIVGGNINNAFKIAQSGQVQVANSPDRETQATYKLVIRAFKDGTKLASEVTTTINVLDVNDVTPKITFMETQPKDLAVEDYSPKGSFVVKVIAIDRDAGANGQVTYSITTPNTPFQIDQNTGVITASREIRRSELQSWTISVQASDSKGRQSSYSLRFTVTEGIQAPQLPPTFSVALDENKPVGFTVKDISPTTPNSNYKYNIRGGNTDEAFCINHDGVISVARPLDREKISSYSLKVSVSVGNKVSNTSVDVTIRDKNDDAPRFTKAVYSFDVSEDKGFAQEVGKVSAEDKDTGDNGEVEYRLLYAVNVNSKFNVDLKTGSITTVAAPGGSSPSDRPLDFEQIKQHVLYILAMDKGIPSLSTIAKVMFNVKDVNDQTPKFSADSYVSKVALDAKVDSQVLLVVATDLDSGDNGKVVYNITGGNEEGAFKIDPDTGVIKVKRSLTTVSASTFALDVEAKDKGNPPRSTIAKVNLNVFLPDGPPKFVVKPVVQEVTEGIKANNRVMVVKAATSEALTYEVVSGNEDGLFRINPSTGEIMVTRELDYEEARERRLVVRVMDTRDRSDQVTVILQIKNINDNAPTFPGEVNGYVERKVEDDFQIGDPVARLSAFDGDAGDKITYTLSENARASFTIDEEGFLIAKKPRKEFSSPVTFDLAAKDNGSPPRESKVNVQLVLVSYRPEQQHPVREYVREDKEVGSVVAIVPRYFPGGTLSIIYPRKANFTVDNSGRVRMTTPFDFEARQLYTLTVREQEPSPLSRTNDVDVEINVIDINDNKPVMKMVEFFGRVNTNSRPGTSAYQLRAEDKDGGLSGRIGYQMVSRGVPFAINPLTEVVETGGKLEDRGGYNVTVFGFDFGVPRQFGDSVYLDIKTVNFKPQFSESSYNFEVFENDLPGKVIGVVNATSASGARLGFSIVQGDTDNKFSIESTGELVVNSKLDREMTSMYNLKVRTTEQIPRGYSNDVDVRISVKNANEYYPYFPLTVYEKSINEDVGSGASVLSITAYDCDCTGCVCNNAELKYSLEGTSVFKIDEVTGLISVGDTPLDYETQRIHLFKVVVEDFGEKKFSSRSYVRVSVQNKNDEEPKFQRGEYSIDIAEDAITNKALAAILARDGDGDSSLYTITSGASGIFDINRNTGVLSLVQSVLGQKKQYTLTVRATDTAPNPKFDEVRVVINIEDINDNRPVFTVCPKEVTVEENKPTGERVTQVTAKDSDNGRNGEVEYKLVTGGERLFEINNSTGLITTITSLDRETADRHTLIVQAEDGGHGRNEAERLLSYCIIEVKVADVNDNYPVFFTRQYDGSVFQKAPVGTTVLTVSATDDDVGNNEKVVYSLVGSNDKFEVDGATGSIRTIADLSNFQQTVLLKIRASNQATPTATKTSSSETTVEINVVNQQPPKFQPNSVYTAEIQEDVEVGTAVVTVKAVSQVDSKNVIAYSLVKSYPSAEQNFKVDPGTGVISTASTLNYEQQSRYTLQIRARENKNNLYATCSVNIRLKDVNDDTPTFKLEEYSARVPEETVGGFNAITVKADDRDTGLSGEVFYSLDASQKFRIVASNGTIFSQEKFDREDQKTHTVFATATDRGTPPLQAKVAVSVVVVDQNDEPPLFPNRKYTANVQEDAPIGTSIDDLTATDADIGDNARLEYFISGGEQSQLFRMETVYSPENKGILYLNGKLDYETKPTYTIKVTATDRKNSDTVDVVIAVLDTNDNVPKFTTLIYKATIREETNAGEKVTQVSATDLDSRGIQDPLVYSIDKTGQRYFSINSKTGEITTANEKLDREKDQTISFYVFAYDGKHSGEALVRVNLTDINDNAPYFPNPPYVGYVEENKNPGTSVMVLQAVDLDTGINAVIHYELLDNAGGKFKIDQDTGLVTTLETLEREGPENEFTVRVRATNRQAGAPLLSGTVTATIKVSDGNDQSPMFDPLVYKANVLENALPGYLVTKVAAIDKDVGPNAELEYTITAGNDPYEFYIDPRNGRILVSGLLDFDKGKKTYNLTVTVSDRGNPPKSAPRPALVYINVLDANDNPPIFVPADYNKKVSESVKPGDTVLLVTAVDKDTGTNAQFQFSITEGDDANMFAVRSNANNGSIGEIYTLLQLDRETVPRYNLTVTATDSGGLQGIAVVHLTITDINDNGPWFKPRYFEGAVKAGINPSQGQPVVTLEAYDPDEAINGPPFTFSLVNTDLSNRFKITKATDKTANMAAFGEFNRDVKQSWKVQVKAEDSGNPTMDNTTFVYIDVEDDRNRNEPFDGKLTIIVNAYNGRFAGGIIGKAYYRDNDYNGDQNKYSMDVQSFLTLTPETGDITAEANIPLGRYTFSVKVEETKQRPGNFPKIVTSDVTVIVQSVTNAAIQQSVAVLILEMRKTSFFVADFYTKVQGVLANILTGGDTDQILIFSIQKAPANRVPLSALFGVEIYLSVKSGGGIMDRLRVLNQLIQNKQRLEELGLKIGSIGIDACAYEQQQVGICKNILKASSAFTVVSGDYGQVPATESSLTVVAMNVNLQAEYTSIILPEINCTTGTPCFHGGTCHNAVPKGIICECGREYRGPECQSTTRTFKGNSYLWLEKLAAYERSTVSLQFMTGTADGLLLYQGPVSEGSNNGLPDVMAVMMVGGYIKLVLSLGPHPNAPLELFMNRGDRLDDRQWHTVEVIRELKKVTVRIDLCSKAQVVEDDGQVLEKRAACEIEGEVWGSHVYLNGFGPLQIGGVENKFNDAKISYAGFQGCIRNIKDNNVMYDLLNPVSEKNTDLGCKLENNPCPDCNDHGYCEPLWTNSICVCDLGYSGPNCNSRTNANWYKPNSFTQYRIKQTTRKRRELVPPPVSMSNEFFTNIALQVRISPESSNVVVFLASNSLGTEFNRIDVKNHVLRYIFRLGDRMKILSIPQLNVTDDKYHTVVVKREGNRAKLQIDYDGKVEGTTGGIHKLLNMGGGSFFTGGLPNVTEVRVVEAFVNSGGNAILRTADGNIISSGIGSGLAGYSSSDAELMGTMITVGRSGQVHLSSSYMKMYSSFGMRAVVGSSGRVFVGRTATTSTRTIIRSYSYRSYTPIGVKSGGKVNVRVIPTNYDPSGGSIVISSTKGGSAVGSSGGKGSAGGGSGASDSGGSASDGGGVVVDGGGTVAGGGGVVVGGSGGVVVGGGTVGHGQYVTGATVLGGASSADAYGQINAYGTSLGGWTLLGATPNGAKEIEVIGDFGGCTASNSYNGVDLDNDPSIEARRQNVEFGCPCSSAFCLHGGTCVDAVPPYCMCPPGWTGPRCETVVTSPNPGTRPGSRWANPAVIAIILVVLLAILAIVCAVLLKRRPAPAVVAVVEDGHVHDNIRPYHDEGAGEEDNFGYDITTLMKYSYVENGIAGTGGAGSGKFKDAGGIGEEEFTVAENKPLLQGAMPGTGLQHGVTTMTKRRVVHPESIDVKQFIDTRVHEADGEYILSIDELHIYRYEGDDSDVDDLSELGDSDEEPDEEEEQEFAFLQEWGKKFDNLNRIFNEDD